MAAVDKHQYVAGLHRYKKKSIAIPVLPPKIPSRIPQSKTRDIVRESADKSFHQNRRFNHIQKTLIKAVEEDEDNDYNNNNNNNNNEEIIREDRKDYLLTDPLCSIKETGTNRSDCLWHVSRNPVHSISRNENITHPTCNSSSTLSFFNKSRTLMDRIIIKDKLNNNNINNNNNFDYRLRYGLSILQNNQVIKSSNGQYGYYKNETVTSSAAAFFARASQNLNLTSSPHRRKHRNSESENPAINHGRLSFANILQNSPPQIPTSLLKKIGQRDTGGIGKVKVMLKVCGETTPSEHSFNVDKKRRQVTLYEPASIAGNSTPIDRKLAIAAPKMFAFDALFTDEDSQTEICGSALIDVIHAVINGNDGCLFCFGHAKLGKSRTMIGSADSSSSLGIIPNAISWLYRSINEQRQKTGSRFSIRISAIEIISTTQQIRDLLVGYASDVEQSPGMYLRDDPVLGNNNLQNQSELRAPSAEKAAFYFDVAVNDQEFKEDSHLLYTIHVYQYNVAGKGGLSQVAGGRSRLYLLDIASSDRTKLSTGISWSAFGNVLLAIFNGQKHLPHREHKITQIMKECLSSLTCHVAMIAHVSPQPQNYHETLTTVQLASRIHRMRRRKYKFMGVGVNTSDEVGKLSGSSDVDPSSSEQSADTVIYVGPSEETDGEHPPVYIPSLNSADNRGEINLIRDSSNYNGLSKLPIFSRSVPASPQKTLEPKCITNKHKQLRPPGVNSAKSSPVKTRLAPKDIKSNVREEYWIDGPKISKSKVVEARNVHNIMKIGGALEKRETWVDGPMKNNNNHSLQSYGFMDSHKKSMIKKWVENQAAQVKHKEVKKTQQYKEFTVFKTYDECDNDENGRGCASGQEEDLAEENLQKTSHAVMSGTSRREYEEEIRVEEMEGSYNNEDIEIEIIEVEEPEEPVPMQDCCLQVTEEDIAFCMEQLENKISDIDHREHPLRILSQENMTVVSTFTDSLSIANDAERFFPIRDRSRLNSNNIKSVERPVGTCKPTINNDQSRFQQLSKLHEIYNDKFGTNGCGRKHGEGFHTFSKCQSLMFSDIFDNNIPQSDYENNSVASEPAYFPNETLGKLCHSCKVNLVSPVEDNNKFPKQHQDDFLIGGRYHFYRHMRNIFNLRRPDGSSNPNLFEGLREPGNGAENEHKNLEEEEEDLSLPPPLPSKLLTLSHESFDHNLLPRSSSPRFSEGDFKYDMKREICEPSTYGYSKANIKKLETSWNRVSRLLELRREQKHLMNELACARQGYTTPNSNKWTHADRSCAGEVEKTRKPSKDPVTESTKKLETYK